jgi:beta-phosphoglucomutase-like phosphatase (HAD superfamily)
MDGVLASPFVSGAKETLAVLSENDLPAYIVSGTPDREIKLIVERKGLSLYFKEVYGSPRKKQEICQEIIRRENYNSPNCLFIGDATSDYETAQKNGICCFLGIVREEDKVSLFPHNVPISSTVTVAFSPLRKYRVSNYRHGRRDREIDGCDDQGNMKWIS